MTDTTDRTERDLMVRRHDHRDGAETLEPSYQASVARFRAKLREENLSQWTNYYEKLARLHALLAEENAQKAKLCSQQKGED